MKTDDHKANSTSTETVVKYHGLRYLITDIMIKIIIYYKKNGLRWVLSKARALFSGRLPVSWDIPLPSRYTERRCKVCGVGELIFLEKKPNIHGIAADIYICRNCLVITNVSAYQQHGEDSDSNERVQRDSSEDFYRYTVEEVKNIESLVEANKEIIRSVLPYLGHVQDRVFLEIGSGKGLLLVAASELGFKKVIGVDYNTTSFMETKKLIKVKNNIFMFNNIDDVPPEDKADCFVMWHTLEHIPKPNDFFKLIDKRLNQSCILLVQVPQYNHLYLCDTDYHFYNEPSISLLLKNNGWHIIKLEYDCKLQFMAVIAKRR